MEISLLKGFLFLILINSFFYVFIPILSDSFKKICEVYKIKSLKYFESHFVSLTVYVRFFYVQSQQKEKFINFFFKLASNLHWLLTFFFV